MRCAAPARDPVYGPKRPVTRSRPPETARYRPGSSHAGSRLPTGATSPDPRAHGRAQCRAGGRTTGRTRPGACAAKRVRPRDRGWRRPAAGRFADVAAGIVRGPTSLPIWGASCGRWALQLGRAIPDAVRFAGLVRRHRIDVIVVNSTVLRGARHRRPAGRCPGHRARAGGAEVRGRKATVPRARRAGAHGRRDLTVDRSRPSTAHARASCRIPSASTSRAIRGRVSCAPPIRSSS